MRQRRIDWADLLPELIHLISSKLPDVTVFIRFRAVCKSWRSFAPLSDPPPQFPWLLECIATHIPKTRLEGRLRFYTLATGETGILHVKESLRGISYHGPCSGYLILLSDIGGQLRMWNPLTNADISFPLVRHFVCSLWPVWTGSDPILSRNIIFVARDFENHNRRGCWAYHPGSTEWNVMKGRLFESWCYWDGMLFTTSGGHDTKILCGTLQNMVYEIPSPECSDDPGLHSYLVEISGVIMRVCMYLGWHQKVEDSIFHFYELHFEGRDRKPSWVKVNDIGNHVLFLDVMNGFSMKPIDGLKGNCIYFLSLYGNTPCRFDIATGTFQRLPCPFKACTWFFPSLC